jgi:hypothetical protein
MGTGVKKNKKNKKNIPETLVTKKVSLVLHLQSGDY